MTLWRYLSALCLVLITILSHAQEKTSKINYKINDEEMRKNPHLKYWIIDPSASKNKKESTSEDVRIIVRLKTSPSTIANTSARTRNEAVVNEEHRQFLADINTLQRQSATGRGASSVPTVMREYKRTFNGFALSTQKNVADQIRQLPNVIHVYEDKKAEAYDLSSNELINVPKVWAETGATGKDITIGIIDTGIDYTHPALGGGIGSSFKVLGGYDFVNNDNDPLDDHGHGTHVAGIAAANSTELKGVAPDAKLYAFKVLSANGWGYDSDVLAAIEKTTDPDGDPSTDDALDVVNMSLGRQPDANEPLSHAVNNAVLNGVTFVIAAGNGYNFQSIGTPGIAEHAITVGAVDQNRSTAYFSSKGPVEKTFQLKPDVAAPGVDIYSSYLNSQYSNQSGTSMASPHVAGVAALLLEKHPTWTPAIIKSSLMTTATSMQAYVWEQGAGVIDAFAAITNDILLSPGSISFGAVDISAGEFQTTRTITITNVSAGTRDFSLSLEGTIQNSAIGFSFSESVFSLQPAETKTITVGLTVDPSLPLLNLPDAYTGNILLTSSDGSVRKSIVTLINAPVTRLQFAGELPSVFIVIGLEGNYYWQPFFPTEPVFDLYLPAGKYDIITYYEYNRTVISEGISSATPATIELDKAMAKNAIVFAPSDKNGQPIPLWSGHGSAFFTGEGKNIITVYFGAVDTLFINDQKDYGFDMKIFAKAMDGSSECYEVTGSTGFGIDRSMLLSNDGNFTRFQLLNPSVPRNAQQNLVSYLKAAYFTTWLNQPISVANPITVFRSQNDSSKFGGTYVRLDPTYGDPGFAWETGAWKIDSHNAIYFTDTFDKYLGKIPGEFEYELGKSLVKFNGYTVNTESRIALADFPSSGTFNRFYGEREHGGVAYKLSSGGTVVKSGIFNNRMMSDLMSPTLNIDFQSLPQAYQLDISYDSYQVGGRFGQATATLEFNTAGNDKNSPLLDYISLEADGVSTTEITTPESAVIKFKVIDTWPDYVTGTWIYPSGISEVTLEIKGEGDESWLPLSLEQNTTEEWFAPLPSDLDPGYYQVRVKAKDNENNLFTYALNPGFLLGQPSNEVPYAVPMLLEPFNHSINAGVRPLFKWSAFEGASYTLQVSRTSDFLNSVIDEVVTTNEFQPQTDLKKDSLYYWRVKAWVSGRSTPWSEVNTFEARKLAAPVLTSPENDALNVDFEHILFQWEKAQGALQYNFEISFTEDFSSLMTNVWLPETASSLDWYGFTQGTQYFWRVTAYYYTFDHVYPVMSEPFKFTTIQPVQPPGEPQLVSPRNLSSRLPYRNLYFEWKEAARTFAYYFELSNDSTFYSLTKAEWLPANVTSVNARNLVPGSNYYWRVTAYGDNYALATSSQTFSFTTMAAPPPKLRFPENRSNEVQYRQLTFEWERSESAMQYYFELSEKPDFSDTRFKISTDKESLELTALDPEKVYYWRITATHPMMSSAISSNVFSFTTAGSRDDPSDLSTQVYPNPFDQKISIVVYSRKVQLVRFSVVNQAGQKIKKSNHQFERGFNTIEWSVTDARDANLPEGIYLGIIEGSSGRKTVKLILKRK